MPRIWHLQVCTEREWVVWWYGPREDGKGHIEPADHSVTVCGETYHYPFQLPDVEEWSKDSPPQEIRRVKCWGWRFRTNDGIHNAGWYLADSHDACLLDAKEYLGRQRLDTQENMKEALEDVRVYFGRMPEGVV